MLDAAIDQFGRHGICGASTRAIAAAAGTAMSSITYHYGGKEGIYLAAAYHIAERCERVLAPTLERASLDGELDGEAAIEKIDELVVDLLHLMLDDQSAPWARFILREQLEPTDAFDILYSAVLERVGDRLIDVMAQLGRGLWSSTEIRLKAFTILSQVRMFRTAPEMLQRMTGLDPTKSENADAIEQFVRRICRATLLA
ncbi:CerR family C-terminal domain-containing protein [Sphingomonas zeae]|uniref:CerR family C-terminal domain-containing protein n=1 Tax=Sphingomonas zeae TaxID=1646122 RepID=UPI00137582C4